MNSSAPAREPSPVCTPEPEGAPATNTTAARVNEFAAGPPRLGSDGQLITGTGRFPTVPRRPKPLDLSSAPADPGPLFAAAATCLARAAFSGPVPIFVVSGDEVQVRAILDLLGFLACGGQIATGLITSAYDLAGEQMIYIPASWDAISPPQRAIVFVGADVPVVGATLRISIRPEWRPCADYGLRLRDHADTMCADMLGRLRRFFSTHPEVIGRNWQNVVPTFVESEIGVRPQIHVTGPLPRTARSASLIAGSGRK